MVYKFTSVPTNFDQNVPIISRSGTTTPKKKLSFRNTIRSTCEYLVDGYTTNINLGISNKIHIPKEVKQICFNYFIGDFPSSIHDDQLSKFNENAQSEFIQSSLNILCPGTIKPIGLKFLLAHFINLTQSCMFDPSGRLFSNVKSLGFGSDNTTNTSTKKLVHLAATINKSQKIHYTKSKNRIYFSKVYLSYLVSLTQITDFFDILKPLIEVENDDQQIDCAKDKRTIHVNISHQDVDILRQEYEKYGKIEAINILGAANVFHKFAFITFMSQNAANRFIMETQNTDYLELIIAVACEIADEIGVQLICQLISQNNVFYEIYKSRFKKNLPSIILLDSVQLFIKNYNFQIESLRKLLCPLVFDPIFVANIAPLHTLSLLILNKKCLKISWLWLQKELENVCLNKSNICLHKTFLENILSNIISKLQTLSTKRSENNSFTNVFGGDVKEAEVITPIAIDILYLLIETTKLNISYKISNFKNFVEMIVTELLRKSDKYDVRYGIIGWKILNMEIDKMINMNQDKYEYFDEWILFFESKAGLLQRNMVLNINILKKKENGNMKNAQIQLEFATTVCFKVYQMSYNKFEKFNKFYRKLEKTKLLKPILSRLR